MFDLKKWIAKIMQMLMAISIDYVVQEGTSGGWYYRKWASGHLEQYYRGNPGAYTVNTARGSLYSGGNITYTYPIPFVGSYPKVVVGATLSTDAYVIWAQEKGLSLTSITVRIVAGASISQNNGYEIHIHAIGRWK